MAITGVTWGLQVGGTCPPNIFLAKNRVLATQLKRDKSKVEIFSERLFGWCKDRKNETPVFYGRQNRGI
jgi:hypothetical protein